MHDASTVTLARSARLAPLAGLVALLVATSGGCMQVRYLTQAARGQLEISRGAVDISRVLADGRVEARTRRLLAHVPRIKAFGERHGLKRTQNYLRYVDLKRPQVVWVVSACEPLRFRSKTWSFPIVGSITYLGWFHRAAADRFAASLAREGWDVDVRPSRAYSTLGWLRDPVVSPMILPGEEALGELVNVILHESVHATYYVKGQSTLNESVAAFVGDGLAQAYLDEALAPASNERSRYLERRRATAERQAALRQAYLTLQAIYESPRSNAEKWEAKGRLLRELRERLRLRRPINNATLVQYRTYGSGKREMAALLAACGGSWPRLLATLEKWRPIFRRARPHTDAGALLRPLLPRGCAGAR